MAGLHRVWPVQSRRYRLRVRPHRSARWIFHRQDRIEYRIQSANHPPARRAGAEDEAAIAMLGAALDEYQINCPLSPVRVMYTIPSADRTALSLLLENARRKIIRIWAEQAPFDLKDELKKRGYRWSSGDEGRPKACYVDIDEAKRDDEIAYLRKFIYLRDVELFVQPLSAFDRFSVRV